MFQEIRRSACLIVTELEERCVPATGIGPAFDIATIIPISAPVMVVVRIDGPIGQSPEPARPVVRADLFCAGMPTPDSATEDSTGAPGLSELIDEMPPEAPMAA